MKAKIFTTIGVAILGLVASFFITNLIIPGLEPYSFTVISRAQSAAADGSYDYANLIPPNNEVFNYNAVNPTVEAYVGNCARVDANGNCVDDITGSPNEQKPQTNTDGTDETDETDGTGEPDGTEGSEGTEGAEGTEPNDADGTNQNDDKSGLEEGTQGNE